MPEQKSIDPAALEMLAHAEGAASSTAFTPGRRR